jgi:hypothetical protein
LTIEFVYHFFPMPSLSSNIHFFQTSEPKHSFLFQISHGPEQIKSIEKKETATETVNLEKLKIQLRLLEKRREQLEGDLDEKRAEFQKIQLVSLAAEKIMEEKFAPTWAYDNTFNIDNGHVDVNIDYQFLDDDLLTQEDLKKIGISIEKAVAILNKYENEIKDASVDIDKCYKLKDKAAQFNNPDELMNRINKQIQWRKTILEGSLKKENTKLMPKTPEEIIKTMNPADKEEYEKIKRNIDTIFEILKKPNIEWSDMVFQNIKTLENEKNEKINEWKNAKIRAKANSHKFSEQRIEKAINSYDEFIEKDTQKYDSDIRKEYAFYSNKENYITEKKGSYHNEIEASKIKIKNIFKKYE